MAEAQLFLQCNGDGPSPSSSGNRYTYIPQRYVLYIDNYRSNTHSDSESLYQDGNDGSGSMYEAVRVLF